MSITNIQTLHDLAETSLASYAYLENISNLEAALQVDKIGANFTPDQAAVFVAKYELVSTQPNIDFNGFSATVFQNKQTLLA